MKMFDMEVGYISYEKQLEFVGRFKKFNKDLCIRPFAVSKTNLFISTNLKRYYHNFAWTGRDNIRDCIETLKEVKDDFNLSDKDIEEIEKELRKIHREALDDFLAKKL